MKKPSQAPSLGLCEKLLHLIAPSGAYNFLYTVWDDETGRESWRTKTGAMLSAHELRTGKPFGVRPSKYKSYFLAIDIDNGSKYHPSADGGEAIENIRHAFGMLGLECIIVQSTNSTGIHLWFPLNEIQTACLVDLAERILGSIKMEIKPGVLEVFPNRARSASELNGIRIPLLSKGSGILDDDLNPLTSDIEYFCHQWERLRDGNAIDEVDMQMKAGYFHSVKRAEQRLEEGFTGFNQTDALASSAGYIGASLGLKGAALRSYICKCLEALPGFSMYCRHKKEVKARKLSNWWGYYSGKARPGRITGGKRIPDAEYNSRKAQEAERRVAICCSKIVQQDRRFRTITEARQAIIKLIHQQGETMSIRTLMKYEEHVKPLVSCSEQVDSTSSCPNGSGRGVKTLCPQSVSHLSSSTDGGSQSCSSIDRAKVNRHHRSTRHDHGPHRGENLSHAREDHLQALEHTSAEQQGPNRSRAQVRHRGHWRNYQSLNVRVWIVKSQWGQSFVSTGEAEHLADVARQDRVGEGITRSAGRAEPQSAVLRLWASQALCKLLEGWEEITRWLVSQDGCPELKDSRAICIEGPKLRLVLIETEGITLV